MSMVALLLLSSAFLIGGAEPATIVLGALIGALGVYKPATALWTNIGFLVFACVALPPPPPGPLPLQYYFWGAGAAMIATGASLGWLGKRPDPAPATSIPFDSIMRLIFAVCVISSIYGIVRGNSPFAVVRQLFGCALLFVYYLLGQHFFLSLADIEHWIKNVTRAVAAASAVYSAKAISISLRESSYFQDRSPLAFLAGGAVVLLFVEILRIPSVKARILNSLFLVFCTLEILASGARFVMGSAIATVLIVVLLRQRRRVWLGGIAFLLLSGIAVGIFVSHLDELTGQLNTVAGLAQRFSPINITDDWSYLSRIAQMQSIFATVRQHPILGAGMGADVNYVVDDHPNLFNTTPYVDNGWGFVLLKMGLVGLLLFLALIWKFLRFAVRPLPPQIPLRILHLRESLLALLLFGILSFTGGPTFFQFTSSSLLGVDLGALGCLWSILSSSMQPSESSIPA
ncbi:MAG: O-antigen ligase family protein [Acidobacteriota bacterium]